MTTGVRVSVRTAGALAAIVSGVLCATCNYGEVRVVEPAATGRGPLMLSIQADPEDAAVARELGWGSGIPGAEVTVSPGNADTATGPPLGVFQTDAAGALSIPDLPDGHYLVAVRRLMTSAEVARLAPTEDVIGFMGQAVVASGQGKGTQIVVAPTSRRHSVVISEWAFNPEWITGAGVEYDFGGYLELANNSDTIIYLDGLVIGEAVAQAYDYPNWPCSSFENFDNDPDGVWTAYFDSLPGTGHTYSLSPGAVVVIATDAIDHSAIVPGGLDLSHANFEFIGTADADNPSVPNTVSIGLRPYYGGHGLYLNDDLEEVVFVALPLDVAALPRQVYSVSGKDYVRVPRERLLDVVALRSTYQFNYAFCPHLVHANFDRHPARGLELGYKVVQVVSAHRKVAYTRPDGRMILQHTRTGIADFFRGPRTPGGVP